MPVARTASEAIAQIFGGPTATGGLGGYVPDVTTLLQNAGFPVPQGVAIQPTTTFPQYQDAAKAADLMRQAQYAQHPFQDPSRAFDEIQSLWNSLNTARAREFLTPIGFQDFLGGKYEGGVPVAQRIRDEVATLFEAVKDKGGTGSPGTAQGVVNSMFQRATGQAPPPAPVQVPQINFNQTQPMSPFQKQVQGVQQAMQVPQPQAAAPNPATLPPLPNGVTVQDWLAISSGNPQAALAALDQHAPELAQAGVYNSWRAYLQRLAQGG